MSVGYEATGHTNDPLFAFYEGYMRSVTVPGPAPHRYAVPIENGGRQAQVCHAAPATREDYSSKTGQDAGVSPMAFLAQ